MRIAIAADHAGASLRDDIVDVVRDAGHEPLVLGADLHRPDDDYPTFAKLVGQAIVAGHAERALLICGSGAGVTVAANKLPGVRAALAHDVYTARQMVEHDFCNVLTLGARAIGVEPAKAVVQAFIGAEFTGEARHRRRLGEVIQIEREQNVNPLKALHETGQSIWLDNIRRLLLESGTLARYISSLWVTGLTSNPTIFEHAIAGSADYDEAILKRLDKGLTTEELFFELALEDIVAAADLFRPIYESTNGVDGFVSLEVSPTLADDSDGTIAEAHRLHGAAARPNVFIKVPGTEAGVVAIEELIFAGIPINVTLLFSREHYLASAEAYLRGLERRMESGLSFDVASVASLFISRWDAAASPKLPQELHNKLGVAVGQMACKAYMDLLRSERWQRLEKSGARPQRLLFASTSAKDPTLPDTYYVSALAADLTVNTMPEATLLAFGHHGKVGAPLSADTTEAEHAVAAIIGAGVDVDALAQALQIKARDSFDDSFAKLLESIEAKVATFAEARDREAEHLGSLGEAADAAFAGLSERDAARRIWSGDYTLWGNDPTEISNRLGWLVSPHEMEEQIDDLETFAKQAVSDGFTHAIWSGMGGSSLFPHVLRETFGVGSGGLNLRILDTSDPGSIHRLDPGSTPFDKTLFVFASKSGGTLEVRSHLSYFWERVGRPAQFAVVTDPGSELDKLATMQGFRRVFRNNPNLGGRYSALSHFGLVPGALLGVDIRELVRRAGYMVAAVGACVPPSANPALRLGAVLTAAAKAGRDKCTLVMPPEVSTFGMWLEQLIAESTGKQGVGILPIAGEDLGPADVYGDDRIFVSLGRNKGLDAIAAAGHPVVELDYVDPFSIGTEVVRWEYAIAMAGSVLGINPFDQPNVEGAKKAAAKVLEEGMPDIPTESLDKALGSARPGDYIAIQAFIDIGSPDIAGLQKARMALRDTYRVATTLGIGPRFLHSTGQLHKGGSAAGVFLQVVGDDPIDVAIPGKPFSFSQLKNAQAAGDYLALKEQNRRVTRVALNELLNFGQ